MCVSLHAPDHQAKQQPSAVDLCTNILERSAYDVQSPKWLATAFGLRVLMCFFLCMYLYYGVIGVEQEALGWVLEPKYNSGKINLSHLRKLLHFNSMTPSEITNTISLN